MKNLKKLGFIFSVGTIAAYSIAGCSSNTDTPTPASMGGTATGGSSAGTATGGGGSGTGGSTAGSGGATGGGGAGGSGGSKGGAGGAGGGGAGGTGGASGGAGGTGGASGGAGGSGGAPSADCKKWCQGAMGVVMECSANNLPAAINTEDKCLAKCATAPAASLTCWNMHLGFIIAGMPKDTHCKHAEGAVGNGACPEL